ncbi:ankyrin repeat domain-containing protein [Pseudomonas sp. 30_B]|uniref:ankyrin repeat domain-containing protein n=1 Tax=Pseudomonas sp. 30_B TaxID=2813575 RepID=UPI001A9E86DE|nr:ankyrin repeat domain-containing protein [Pseudomonas sp. 30_B]
MDTPTIQTEDVHSRAAAEALLGAASAGRETDVAALLKRGVPVDATDSQGNTALLLATAHDHIGVARLLIAAGADVNRQNRIHDSAYLLAGASGRLEILKLTLANGANLRSTNRYGGTALIPACERGHVEVVETLLKAGVDPDHVNKLGWTGLLEAILLSDGGPRHQAIVQRLINAGANLNLADNDGITPLQHARQRNQTTIARMLEAAGAH